jgi:hypothetical protein
MSATHQDNHFMIELEGAGLKFDTLWHENEPIMTLHLTILTPGRKYREPNYVSIGGKLEEDKLIYVEQKAKIFTQVW